MTRTRPFVRPFLAQENKSASVAAAQNQRAKCIGQTVPAEPCALELGSRVSSTYISFLVMGSLHFLGTIWTGRLASHALQ